MNAHHHQTRTEAELGRAVVRIAELEDELERLRDLLRIDDVGTPLEWCLTGKESELVVAMAGAAPGVLTAERALTLVWPREAPQPRIITVMNARIRKKLEPFGITIQNVFGRGWVLSANGVEAVRRYRTLDTAP